MKTVSVQQITAAIHRKFRIDMDIYEVIENSIEVLKKMGMTALTRKQEVYAVSNYCVKLPMSVNNVNSAIQLESHNLPNNLTIQDVYRSPLSTISNEVITVNTSDIAVNPANEEAKLQVPSTPKGPWIDFTWDCPYVRFNFTDFSVFLEYTELAVDANGYPLIPEEAFNACIYYNIYMYSQPGFLTGQVPQYVLKEVEAWKNQHINQSKNSKAFGELSRNEHSKLFDILTSMDRKRTNIDN